MEMKQCQNGHFYDQSKTQVCPYCNSAAANVNVTRPAWLPNESGAGIGATVPVNLPEEHTRANMDAKADDSERTVAVIKKEMGIDPVVGWLVCIEGKEKGRDYRMHADNNYIGRSEKMDICIQGDDTISRENHAVVSFDIRDAQYYFSPGEGRSIVHVNDKAVFNTVELSAYDVIELGNTKFLFIPLCGEAFQWK